MAIEPLKAISKGKQEAPGYGLVPMGPKPGGRSSTCDISNIILAICNVLKEGKKKGGGVA